MDEDTKKTLCRLVGKHVTEILKDAIHLERLAKRGRFTYQDDKCVSIGKRVLDVQDINHALIYRGLDPMMTTIHNNSNQRVDLNEYLTSEMQERVPTEITLNMHWLAVDGVQPQIPQNPIHSHISGVKHGRKKLNNEKNTNDTHSPSIDNNNNNNNNEEENNDDLSDTATSEEDKEEMEGGDMSAPASVRQLLPRLLSEELQLYFTRVTVAMERGSPPQQDAALLSVARDAGTQELVPFFSRYISSQIYKHIGKPLYCNTLIRLAHALFTNPHLHLELHLHQILPAVITCVVAKRLSSSLSSSNCNEHWALRRQAALALAQACTIFGNDYTTLKPRVVKTLCEAMAPDKPLTTQYGGIVGMSLFGPKAVDAFILPLATIYWTKWESVLQHIHYDHDRELLLELRQCQHALLDALAIFFQDEDLMEHSKRFNLNALEDAFGEKLIPLHNQNNPSTYLTCFI